jgi:hypothetical protein
MITTRYISRKLPPRAVNLYQVIKAYYVELDTKKEEAKRYILLQEEHPRFMRIS